MRVALANAIYQPNHSGGGAAHIGQFIENTVALGHEVYAWPNTRHPLVRHIPIGRLATPRALRAVDVLYVRIEALAPAALQYARSWRRRLIGNPLVVWEFNTVPEFALVRGKTQSDVDEIIERFRYFGKGCDLAVCVSAALAGYVQERLGIARTLVVPNGSDPDLFRPDVPPVKRLEKQPGQINVVWIGSAYIAWHNIALLREASRIVEQRGWSDRIVFHIIGNGAENMREMPANVHYHGSEEYALLPPWLSGMDIGLVLYSPGPADFSSPLKLFDYMASGLAVLSVNQPQARDIFSELGQPDMLFAADDAAGLADRLIQLASHPERLAEMKSASRQLLVNHYSWKRAVADTFTEIQSLIQHRPRSITNTTLVTKEAPVTP
jgi:glycosyltransferase involved in cell wall biosynthesis